MNVDDHEEGFGSESDAEESLTASSGTHSFCAICETGAESDDSSISRPDFSGSWKLARVKGNWDAFTKDLGYRFMKRKGLGALGWGVGVLTQEIRHDSASLWMKTSDPLSTTEIDVNIDSTEQDGVDPDHVPITIVLWWDGDRLLVDTKDKTTGKPMAVITRSLEDGGMREALLNVSGKEVVRHFVHK